MHTLYTLEDVICRIRALDPDSDTFRSECWEISARIIGQRANDLGPFAKDGALLFMEALLMWEALLARREQRAPSFADIVQRLRASFRLMNPDVPHVETLDVLKSMTPFPRLQVLERVLHNWIERSHDASNVLAMGAIEDLLKQSISYVAQSPTEIALNDRAKVWGTRYWRHGGGSPRLR